MNRRHFITLAAGASLGAASCPLRADTGAAQIVDAGPMDHYAADGVYDAYRSLGFFLVRRNGKLSALSSVCTHRRVTLSARRDCTFYCKRHGSTFDSQGHVTKGPADKDLPALTVSISGAGHVLVRVQD